MSIDPAISQPTRITVHPDARLQEQTAQTGEITRPRKSFQIETRGDSNGNSWGGDGFGVDDFIDLINPLQHIPVVGSVYRALTGDEIAAEARVIGGGLFGGVLGVAAAGVNAMVEQETGKTVAGNVMALVAGEAGPSGTQAAEMAAATSRPGAEAASAQLAMQTPKAPAAAPMAPPRSLLPPSLPPMPDMYQTQEPSEAASQPPRGNLETQDKHDVILDLFGEGVASAHEQYRKAQMIAHVMGVAREMKA